MQSRVVANSWTHRSHWAHTYFRFLFLFLFICFFSRVKYFPQFSFTLVIYLLQSKPCLLKVKHNSECTKCHWIVHIKMANFMLCEFHYHNNKTGTFLPPVLIELEPLISSCTVFTLSTLFKMWKYNIPEISPSILNLCIQFPINMCILLSWKRLPCSFHQLNSYSFNLYNQDFTYEIPGTDPFNDSFLLFNKSNGHFLTIGFCNVENGDNNILEYLL